MSRPRKCRGLLFCAFRNRQAKLLQITEGPVEMTEKAQRNLDDLIFGYDKDVKILILERGKRWFELCDGRVGQEHEIQKAVSNLLETVREANNLAGGAGYVNDFDFMLGREMSERPDLLLSDKPKFDAALRVRLKDALPGLEKLGSEVDLGLVLTAYGRIAHERGQPRPPARSLIERLRERMSDRISPKEVLTEVARAAVTYSEEIMAGRLELDADRSEAIQQTVSCACNELLVMGVDVDKNELGSLKDFQENLEAVKAQSLAPLR